jgi:hypothetical protein
MRIPSPAVPLEIVMHRLATWFVHAPIVLRDALALLPVVALGGFCLWLAVRNDAARGRHQWRGVPVVVVLPKAPRLALSQSWSHVFSSANAHTLGRAVERQQLADGPTVMLDPLDDHVRMLRPVPAIIDAAPETEHVGATEDWHPAAESAAVDTADAEWRQIMDMAEIERVQLTADLIWSALEPSAALNEAMATAEAWHAEHGRHCACCHVGLGDGEESVIWAEWRTGENTIEIKHDRLVAAGIRQP